MVGLIDSVVASGGLGLGTAVGMVDGVLVASSTSVGPVEDNVAGEVELSSVDGVVVQVLVSVYAGDIDTMPFVLLGHSSRPGWRFGGVHRPGLVRYLNASLRRVSSGTCRSSSGRSSSANEILSSAFATYGYRCWPGRHLAEDILRGGGVERGGFERAVIRDMRRHEWDQPWGGGCGRATGKEPDISCQPPLAVSTPTRATCRRLLRPPEAGRC